MGNTNLGAGEVEYKSALLKNSNQDPVMEPRNTRRSDGWRIRKSTLFPLFITTLYFLHVVLRIGKLGYSRRYMVGGMLRNILPVAIAPAITPPVHPCVRTVPPISKEEFGLRQSELAQILTAFNAEAYIAEPGAQSQFFGNFSAAEWKLSERPLFLIITPRPGLGNDTRAEVSILTPKFEVTRAKLLNVPWVTRYIEWAEEENPYAIAVNALGLRGRSFEGKKIIVDNGARHFHYDGFNDILSGTGLVVTSAPKVINKLREQKAKTEIEIMKCANEATLVAIRHVHQQMRIGMRESEARNMMSDALSQIGLSRGGCLTLFGENAALPHGSGTDRILGVKDFALFDCTANLHGYESDVTRTVALSASRIPDYHMNIWRSVESAQAIAGLVAGEGAKAREVDNMARISLRTANLEQYFTHRLGHGIGLEGHEPPYLNGGNEDLLQNGHTFSNEPGVYIEGEVGVRLEDCMYIDDQGNPIYLTEGVGGPSKSPLQP